MRQLGLDWTPPRTHAGDPGSSHAAEARLRASGALSARQRVVLEVVVCTPGLWASQVADRIGASPAAALFPECPVELRHEARRRLSDLCKKEIPLLRHRHTPGEPEARWFHVEAEA